MENSQRKRELQAHKRNARMLQDLMAHEGWVKVVKPILDKMIKETTGFQKENGDWDRGRTILDTPAQLVAYRDALIEFSNNVYSILKIADDADKELKTEPERELRPMEDSTYNTDVNEGTITFYQLEE